MPPIITYESGDITSFLVDKNMPGFTLGQKIEDKCGMRASMTAELVFSDVDVPLRNVVGSVGGASLCMMRNLEIERVVLAAMSVVSTLVLALYMHPCPSPIYAPLS